MKLNPTQFGQEQNAGRLRALHVQAVGTHKRLKWPRKMLAGDGAKDAFGGGHGVENQRDDEQTLWGTAWFLPCSPFFGLNPFFC